MRGELPQQGCGRGTLSRARCLQVLGAWGAHTDEARHSEARCRQAQARFAARRLAAAFGAWRQGAQVLAAARGHADALAAQQARCALRGALGAWAARAAGSRAKRQARAQDGRQPSQLEALSEENQAFGV